MLKRTVPAALAACLVLACPPRAGGGEGGGFGALPAVKDQKPGTWVKRSPLPGGPASPRKGYESSWDWDPFTKRIIRHGGHNQGGGGAQYFETWTLDPLTMKWYLRLPNTSPPGVCCEKDNVFDLHARRFVRFPAFSNSHGWQWTRMIGMRNWSAWAYDNEKNVWRNMKPMPHVGTREGRCAAYDTHHDVIFLFDRHGTKLYDLYTNTWHLPRPPKQPAGRTYGSAVYDRARRRFVMFGRHYGNDPVTWAYDIRLNQWADLKTAAHPPSNRTSPVMAYDSLNEVVLCVVRTDNKDNKLQTWLYDCKDNTWKRLENAGDLGSSGNRNRLMVYVPEHNVFVLENRANREQQIWTFRHATPAKAKTDPPGAPAGLAVEVSADGEAKLSWKPPPGEKPAGYRVFRGTGAVPWKAAFKPLGTGLVKRTEHTDRGLARGKVHYYRVAAVGENGRAGDQSIPARTQPRVLDRVVVSVLGEKEVEVSWKKHPARDVVGYNVYRADVEVMTTSQVSYMHKVELAPRKNSPPGLIDVMGQFKRLNRAPLKEPMFLDKTVDLAGKPRKVAGKPLYRLNFRKSRRYRAEGQSYRFAVYAYRVRAVNALGVESGPSPWSLTIPGAPEKLFSKEQGGTVHLKWEASPEKKLRGYLVYRMNDRFRGRFELVTKQPVKDNKYSDATSGRRQRRFFVIAVDALGQEGVPSSPVWSYREWHRYYKPFGSGLGTWHQ